MLLFHNIIEKKGKFLHIALVVNEKTQYIKECRNYI